MPKTKAITLVLAAWMLMLGLHSQAMAQFQANKNLYDVSANPTADIARAVQKAKLQHKRILLDFGGNWCGDCQLLDLYYQTPANAALLAKYYIVVRVDIGHMDHNVGIAAKYKVPIDHGVPSLAVLDEHGRLLYSEQPKEFEHTSADAINAFLNRWKS
jgi:thiol:disulfide interchange protein